jgi:hypothetical protein
MLPSFSHHHHPLMPSMRPSRLLAVLTLLLAPLALLPAQDSAFCRGFEEGFKSIKGDGALVPICPIEPITPIGSTAFREGIKAGTAKGRSTGGRSIGGMGSRDQDRAPTFCDGFSEGYQTVKGNMAMVPICPIEPITPIGSTPFREGIKAGMKRAGS